MTNDPLIRLETRDDVAYLTLDSPPYNIMTCDLMNQLSSGLEEVGADRSIKAIAVTANGKAFSAGADVGEHTPEKAGELIESFGRLFRMLWRLEIPIVMAVDGAAMGAGFELVQLADVLLASERAKFGQPEILIGFFAPVGVVYLPELVGPAAATEIICSGRSYTAEEMRAFGLVSKVVPADDLGEALELTLKDYRRSSPLIMRINVRMMKKLSRFRFEDALEEAETVFLQELMKTEDVKEGIASFFDKRKPVWKNR